VQIAAAGALYELALHSAKSRALILAAGAIPLLVHLLQHDSPARVQVAASGALCSFVHCGEQYTHAALTAADALPRLVELLASSTTDVQERAAYTLLNLAGNVKTHAAMISAGAIPRMVELLGEPGSTAHAQRAVAEALRNLTVGSDAQARAISDAGAIPRLVKLVEPGSPADVQEEPGHRR
jgi:hypothetical protein